MVKLIKIDDRIHQKLKQLKIHQRQSFNEIICKIIKEKEAYENEMDKKDVVEIC